MHYNQSIKNSKWEFIKLIAICLVTFCGISQQKCRGQYVLGQIEPPDNYVFQVLLEEDEALEYVFSKCDRVTNRNLKLTSDSKIKFKELYNIDVGNESFKVHTGFKDERIVRYSIILDCMGCFRPITFVLSVTPDGLINDLNVMIYRESRGSEVVNGNFLDQFKGKQIDTLNEIDTSVTGATASAKCLSSGTEKGLLLLKEFVLQKQSPLSKLDKDDDKTNTRSDNGYTTTDRHLTQYTQMQYINDTPVILYVQHSSERQVATVMEKVFAEMRRVDTLITKEEKRLNRKGRKKTLEYSSEFVALISFCNNYSAKTNGIFDLTVYDQEGNTSFNNIAIYGNKISFTNKKTKIDLTLVKNGYVVDKGLEIFNENKVNIVAINFGDVTRVAGNLSEEKKWKIGVRYLDNKDTIFGNIHLTDKAVSVITNANYNKLTSIRTKESGHLFNRLTNATVNGNQWASVVSARSGLEASILSYVMFVSGLSNMGSTLSSFPDSDYLMIYDDAEGETIYNVSDTFKSKFKQSTGSVHDYMKAPVCACEY